MGWFLPSHMDSGFIFGLLGLWHLFSVLHSYITNPKAFRCRAWFPALIPKVPREIELWILLGIVTIFICKQLSHATVDIATGVIHAEHLMRFQHVAFSLMYLLYISTALVSERTRYLPLPEGTQTATFALGFLCELIVFHFGHHPGDTLEHYVHMLMQLILVALVLLMFVEVANPTSVVAALARSICLVLKGTWFFYIGVLINVPSSIPLGCSIPDTEDFPTCEQPMDKMRAYAIQVLIFISQMVGVVALTFAGYAFLSWYFGVTAENNEYEEVLDETNGENSQVFFVVDKDGDFSDEVEKAGVPILKNLPRSLSRRMRSNTNTPTRLNSKEQVLSVPSVSPSPRNPMMLASPLPRNLKNV